jgi:hypothetical protein
MMQRFWLRNSQVVCAAAAFAALTAAVAVTSDTAAHAKAQNNGGGGPQQQGGRRPFPQGPPREMRAWQVPVNTLAALLKLSPEQVNVIAPALEQVQRGMRPPGGGPPPPPGSGPGDGGNGFGPGPGGQGGPGGPPPPPQGGDGFGPGPGGPPPQGGRGGQIPPAIANAERVLDETLTADQKARLPIVLRAVKVFRDSGIPLHLIAGLSLSDDQIQRLAAFAPAPPQGGRPDGPPPQQGDGQMPPPLRQRIREVLNDTQRRTIEEAFWDMPSGPPQQPPMGGGPGGPGGPPPPPGGGSFE